MIKESKTIFKGREVFRVKALKNFGNVKAGDVGGWVCSYNNLSQEGDCWIYDEANCLDNAMLFNNAKMYDNSVMFDNAEMSDNAIMFGNSVMYYNAIMLDNSVMYDNAEMYGNAIMFGNTRMLDNAILYGNAKMFGNSVMYGNARMLDNATLDKDKILYGSINKSYKKIFQYHCEKRLITAILTEVNEILYSVGCQIGMTKEEFIARIYNDCGVMGKGLEEYPHRQEYLDIIDMAENYLKKFI